MKSNHDRRVKAEELLRVVVSDLEDASLALLTHDDKILDLQRFVRTATIACENFARETVAGSVQI